MTDTQIKPEKITKPIQLLGAWLTGLLAIDTCFLVAASRFSEQSWQATGLTIAAIFNVPLFLAAVFLLQTRFRPELQEDAYYSNYISQKTNVKIQVHKDEVSIASIAQRLERIEANLSHSPATAAAVSGNPLQGLKFGINKHLEDREAISKLLAEAGIVSFTPFGSDEPPDKRVVSISDSLTPEVVNAILAFVRDAGFQHFNYFDNYIEQTAEDVLLGSYGDGEYEITGAAT
jgi:hypothetical protein